ncbi:unnamed protein product [Rotaria socialis]|uniref:F-box domain-containing protein n=1 Tax=Rotaria socialis TaxID=392032 RepID=A0A817WPN4_9BILA|nr:unnamed protein product [Rotaria socialis]CAF4531068.1 unnamed protein product [Rotaria socialis]
MTLTFESLPNEIWLMIFGYLSSRHMWRAFFGINRRLNQLLTSDIIRHTIDLRDISHAEIVELFDNCSYNSDCQWQTGLVSAAHTICFENEFDYDLLFNRWIIKTTDWLLSSLRVIYVLPEAILSIWSLFNAIQFQTLLESQLRCLHLVFKDPSYTYMNTLAVMIRDRVSYPTMILEVTKGHDDQSWKRRNDLYDAIEYQLCWIYTVRLTLSLQHSSELILLLMPEALPLLEHLIVTIEQPQKNLLSKQGQSPARFELCEQDLRRTNANGTKLRSLVLRHIELEDLLVLLNSLNFSHLDTLTLVDVYDQSLDHLTAFQQSVSPSNLPALKRHQFQYLFRFPAKYEQEWSRRFHNYGWPFENASSHVDEHLELIDNYYSLIDIQSVLLVYSVPVYLLKQMRTVHNCELFTHYLTTVRKNFDRSTMEWLWKWTSNKKQLIKSLEALRTNEAEIVASPEKSNPCIHLRSLTFRFKQYLPLDSAEHRSSLEIILVLSTHLSHLDVHWEDFCRCSGSYPLITHVCLFVKAGEHRSFDVNRLDMLVPKVRYLAIGGQALIREKHLIDFALRFLVDTVYFRELILLQVNKIDNVKLKPRVKAAVKEAIASKIDRLQNSTMTRIEFSYRNQLSIWLR